MFEPGEWIENLEIARVVLIGHMATIYEARRNKTLVTLKVAHPGDQFKQHLKDEAQFLRSQRKDRLGYLPLLLDPYIKKKSGPSEDDWSYGRVFVHDTLLYFLVFEHIEGEPLRDLLSKRPQLQADHAGWIAQSMAIVVQEMHQMRLLHLAISPESALVTFDSDDVPRVVIIDYGALVHQGEKLSPEAYALAQAPYIAPDLRPGTEPQSSADVYSLAVVFAQMLLGDLPSGDLQAASVTIPSKTKVSGMVNRALSQNITSADQFCSDLKDVFGTVPRPRTSHWLSSAMTLNVTITLLAITFLALIVLTLYNTFGL